MSIIWVNNADLEADLGLTQCSLSGIENWGAATSYGREMASFPGGYNSFLVPEATVQRAPIRLSFVVRADTMAALDTQVNTLLGHFTGLLEIRTSDAEDKIIEGVVTGESSSAVSSGDYPFLLSWRRITLDIAVPNPKRDQYLTSQAFGTSPVEIDLGTLPSVGIIRIMPATTPIVTYKDAGGNTIGSMTFATVGATVYLDVDLLYKTITKYTAGVSSNGLADWTAGDWFIPSPEHGDATGKPTLTISSGSALYLHNRRYRA
jgi:hypothetical protein